MLCAITEASEKLNSVAFQMGTFGKTDEGTNEEYTGGNMIIAIRFTAPEDCTVTKISVYVRGSDSPNLNVNIYDNDPDWRPDLGNPGKPNNRLASNPSAQQISSSAQWYHFEGFNVELSEGDIVWLAFVCTGGSFRYTEEGEYLQRHERGTGYPPPDPWGDSPYFQSEVASIYATYTTGGGGLGIPIAMHHYRNLRTP